MIGLKKREREATTSQKWACNYEVIEYIPIMMSACVDVGLMKFKKGNWMRYLKIIIYNIFFII